MSKLYMTNEKITKFIKNSLPGYEVQYTSRGIYSTWTISKDGKDIFSIDKNMWKENKIDGRVFVAYGLNGAELDISCIKGARNVKRDDGVVCVAAKDSDTMKRLDEDDIVKIINQNKDI